MPENETKTNTYLLMLVGIVALLMVAIIGLFIRMNQLQREVLIALEPLQAMRERPQGLEVGTDAPAFTLTDTADQPISLQDFAGQKVLLIFSSTQCPACIRMFPHLKDFNEGSENAQIIMISQGSGEENQQLVKEQDFDFPVLAWDNVIARDYQMPGTPFFYVIDEDGTIANSGFADTLEQLEVLMKDSGM